VCKGRDVSVGSLESSIPLCMFVRFPQSATLLHAKLPPPPFPPSLSLSLTHTHIHSLTPLFALPPCLIRFLWGKSTLA
jgi:hypothetical protein